MLARPTTPTLPRLIHTDMNAPFFDVQKHHGMDASTDAQYSQLCSQQAEGRGESYKQLVEALKNYLISFHDRYKDTFVAHKLFGTMDNFHGRGNADTPIEEEIGDQCRAQALIGRGLATRMQLTREEIDNVTLALLISDANGRNRRSAMVTAYETTRVSPVLSDADDITIAVRQAYDEQLAVERAVWNTGHYGVTPEDQDRAALVTSLNPDPTDLTEVAIRLADLFTHQSRTANLGTNYTHFWQDPVSLAWAYSFACDQTNDADLARFAYNAAERNLVPRAIDAVKQHNDVPVTPNNFHQYLETWMMDGVLAG